MRKQNKEQSKTQASGCPKGEFIWNHMEQQTVFLSYFYEKLFILVPLVPSVDYISFTGRDIPYLQNAKGKTLLKNKDEEEPELYLCFILKLNKAGQVIV